MGKQRILVLCTGNTCRSQMAEVFLRQYVGDRFEVISAGLEPGVINPLTVRVMEELGVDMSGHYAKASHDYLGQGNYRYMITVCSRAERNCPTTFVGVLERMFWPFDDPAAATGTEEERLAVFRRVRDEIHEKVKQWAGQLAK